jgi:hypothetical protein
MKRPPNEVLASMFIINVKLYHSRGDETSVKFVLVNSSKYLDINPSI